MDGKFFRAGERKFYAKGVAYGPFAPGSGSMGAGFPSPEQAARDLAQVRELGANLLRVYQSPPRWFLDLAWQHELRVLVDIPWAKEVCFLDSPETRQAAVHAVRAAVLGAGRHPAVVAFSVANEVPADIVRWSGAPAIENFIDELVAEAKRLDPDCLCTFTNFPPTEFLRPHRTDFVCFNVYLHHEQPFWSYLARLQMLAEGKPLVLGEFGVDSLREGEKAKCGMLAWQIEAAFRAGLAGAVLFAYTDDWWKDGKPVENWELGLTTRERKPKESYRTVQAGFKQAPYFPLSRSPKVSVVVASYNGARTLKACLASLQRLNYPDYEVLLVDDGSTDSTPQIAASYPDVRCLRHEKNLGLSAARNTGSVAAKGEIVAFTDADCRPDSDWLYYIINEFFERRFRGSRWSQFAAAGRFGGSRGCNGSAGRAGACDADRPAGGAYSRLQHGNPQDGAGGVRWF